MERKFKTSYNRKQRASFKVSQIVDETSKIQNSKSLFFPFLSFSDMSLATKQDNTQLERKKMKPRNRQMKAKD